MHEPDTCRYCDVLPDATSRRHWKHEPKARAWHVIADGPDLMARLPRQAHFVTVLAYRLTPEGAHYTGPLYFECDISPAMALEDLRERCLPILETVYGCPLAALHIWHSGARGFHVTIPPLVLGAESGHPLLPRIYGAMIETLFPPSVAATLDRGVYSGGMGRMWRLPNRRRSDTGRYKVPLDVCEVLDKPATDLDALTQRPRKGVFWPSDEELTPCLDLVALYRETAAAVEHATLRPLMHDADMRTPQGQRNATLTRMAGAMRRHGMSEAAILAALLAENQRCNPPLAEAEVRGIAASIARYQPASSHHGQGSVNCDQHPTRGGYYIWSSRHTLRGGYAR